jgi:NitT/TauT family transport system ATP-binding protein
MREPIIRIDHVDVEYPDGHSTRRVLNGITLEIEIGEFVSIVGQTGCGKSTLLRLILGEQKPTRGHVLVNGKQRSQPDRLCGYVPQKYSLFFDKTVIDNVTFGPDVTEFGAFPFFHPSRRKRKEEFRSEALRMLKRVGLSESDARKYPHQLSGGMQQRVAIAQALIMRPPILLMDEAFSALDPGTRRGMQRLIKNTWHETGTTIIFVTHNTREAVCLGTRVIALGGQSVIDTAVPHIDFDSSEDDVQFFVREIESRTDSDINVGHASEKIQKSSFSVVPISR